MMTNQAVSLIPYIDYGWREVERDIGQTWLIAALITLIAAILFGDWERHLFISSMTGSIAYLLGFSGVRIFQPSLHMLRWLLVGSAAISSALCWLLAIQVLEDIFSMATNLWLALISVTIWICVALLFYASIRARVMESAFRREQLQNAENRQQLLAAQLKMLQAQIEPHFLFNSLANVRTLIDLDPKMAKLMLDHMNDYLRATLLRTRKGTGTVNSTCCTTISPSCRCAWGSDWSLTSHRPPRLAAMLYRPCWCSLWLRTRSNTGWSRKSMVAGCASRPRPARSES